LISLSTGDVSKYSINESSYSDLCEYLESRKGKDLFGYSFGPQFGFLDEYTKGLQKGRTYRIGAPSNAGKTQLSYSFVNSFLAQGAKVAFFTLENDKNFTLTNLAANHQKVSSYSIERGTAPLDSTYLSSIKENFFLIDDTYDLGDIFARCLEIKPDIVILDYIGLVNIKKFSEEEKYTEYAKRVQEFVKRTRVGWIDLSNLPKNSEDEESIRNFGGFYGSSFLKNNADVCLHMFRSSQFAAYKKSKE
jgi:replicative DNA helicase